MMCKRWEEECGNGVNELRNPQEPDCGGADLKGSLTVRNEHKQQLNISTVGMVTMSTTEH